METLTSNEANDLLDLAKNTIELKVKTPLFNKSILLANNKIDKKIKMLIKIFYKPTNTLINEIYTPGENNVAYEVVDALVSLFKKTDENIFLKESIINNIDIEIYTFSEFKPLGKNSIERLKNFNLEKDNLFIKYGIKQNFIFTINNKNLNKLSKTALLETACTKIGLPEYYWKQTKVNLFKFEAKGYKKDEFGRVVNL
ncbi:MAG: hypothetical protein ACP5UN_02135 [Candidatus Micrarchaeia archaeon]